MIRVIKQGYENIDAKINSYYLKGLFSESLVPQGTIINHPQPASSTLWMLKVCHKPYLPVCTFVIGWAESFYSL